MQTHEEFLRQYRLAQIEWLNSPHELTAEQIQKALQSAVVGLNSAVLREQFLKQLREGAPPPKKGRKQ